MPLKTRRERGAQQYEASASSKGFCLLPVLLASSRRRQPSSPASSASDGSLDASVYRTLEEKPHDFRDSLSTIAEEAHVHRREMGVLLKETGMSVLVTSTNNILAFFAGTVLPIPALKSFCSQTAILLAFNLIFLMVLFPAIIAIDLKRRRKGIRDMGWCLPRQQHAEGMHPTKSTVSNVSYVASSQARLTSATAAEKGEKEVEDFERDEPWYTVGGFLKNHYIPALKKKGARAREKYFSFYPMFSVLRGGSIGIPHQQAQIEAYRADYAKSHCIIKGDNDQPQQYWLSLMRTWLSSLDVAIDKALDKGDLLQGGQVAEGKKPEPEALIGRAMLCSVGNVWNCSRVGSVRLVVDGIINPEGFYKYVTAWYNIDNMMYYVSQAAFIPLPPPWEMKNDTLCPPSQPLLYSQIPFYGNGLTNTPVIVKMIEEMRAVSDAYTEAGLDNFPTGLAFTFREQYLTLRWVLLQAICFIAAAVFVVIAALISNPYAALMVMVIVVVTTVVLGGFVGLFGVKVRQEGQVWEVR